MSKVQSRGSRREREPKSERDHRHGRPLPPTKPTDSLPRSMSPSKHPARGSGLDMTRKSKDSLGKSPTEDSFVLQGDSHLLRRMTAGAQTTALPQAGQVSGYPQSYSTSATAGQAPGYTYTTSAPTRQVSEYAQFHTTSAAAAAAARPHQSTVNTAPPTTHQHLSELGRRFAAIGLADYERCERFIIDHEDITKEPHRNFLETAITAIRDNRISDAQRCVQQVLMLRRCEEEEDDRREFFGRLIDKDPKTIKDFIDDFNKTYARLKERAEAQGKPGDHVAGPRPTTVSGPQGGRHLMRRVTVNEAATAETTEKFDQMSVVNTAPGSRHEGGSRLGSISENSGSGATITNNSVIRSPGNNTQPRLDRRNSNPPRLDPRYGVYHTSFFNVGRVFSVIWHVTDNSGRSVASDWSHYDSKAPFVEGIHSSPRRMVVLKTIGVRSWCLPVTTYSGKGLSKRGLTRNDIDAHAIMYQAGTEPRYLPEEPGSIKRPIAVILAGPDVKLDIASRVNFSSPHTVEHNERVMNVGQVTEASLPFLEAFFREYC